MGWTLRKLTIFICAVISISCTHLNSAHYVGQKLPVFKDFKQETSIWQQGSNVFYVRPVSDYKAMASSLQWDKNLNRFTQVDSEIIISELAEQKFLNVKEGNLFTILRLVGTIDGQFVIFEPNRSKLEKDITAGLIKVADNSNRHVFELDMSKKKLDAYVEKNLLELFELDSLSVISPVIPPVEKQSTVRE